MELSELKEQNAKEEQELAEVKPDIEEDVTDDDSPAIEPWMQEETEDEEGEQTPDDPSKSVPVKKFVSLKKELRGKISDRDQEIERLRKENEDLKKVVPSEKPVLNRPKAEDFNTDEEYDLAVSKYEEDRLQEIYNRNRTREQQEEAKRQAQEAIEKAMDSHYERADELIKTSGIAKEKYVAAAKNAKGVFTEMFGNGGEAVFENVFSRIGKGSERLEYFIGVNKAAQDKIKSLLKEDPLGLSLAMWLGQEKQRLTNPIKPRSNAPDPAASIKGEINTSGAYNKFKKKYDSAKSPQEAYDIKKAAKQAKVDVSKW